MREIGIILRREFMERIRTRAFLYGTALFPLFMGAIIVLPQLGENGDRSDRRIAIVDETGTAAGPALERVLTTLSEEQEYPYNYIVERIDGSYGEHRQDLMQRVLNGELDGYVVLPSDVASTDTVLYRARNITNRTLLRDVGQAASAAVQAERLGRSGIAPDELVELFQRVEVDEAEITERGEEGRGAATTFWFAYMVAFLVYFMVAFYGVTVMRSVLEEKMNRISEVMVSSVRSVDLMLGKILGVSGAAMLQVGIWAVLGLIATGGGAYLPRLLGLPTGALASLAVPPGQVALLLSFFLLGFLMFASIYAALGAAMTTEQEAQSMQILVLVPLFTPLLFIGAITNEPSGTLSTALSLIPLCAPIAMPMRLATAPVPMSHIALSLAFLAVGVLVVAWVGGRVYRIGILSTGTRPSLRELGKWLREA